MQGVRPAAEDGVHGRGQDGVGAVVPVAYLQAVREGVVKPAQARALRKRNEAVAEARRIVTGEVLAGGAIASQRAPLDLVPTARGLRRWQGKAGVLLKTAEASEGAEREKALDELVEAMRQLVYHERVLALDRLQRAALTMGELFELAMVSPADLEAKLAVWRGLESV